MKKLVRDYGEQAGSDLSKALTDISQLDPVSTVAKLAAARKRKCEATGHCEGRKPHAEIRPDVVKLVKCLGKTRGKIRPLSLGKIGAELERPGYRPQQLLFPWWLNRSTIPMNLELI